MALDVMCVGCLGYVVLTGLDFQLVNASIIVKPEGGDPRHMWGIWLFRRIFGQDPHRGATECGQIRSNIPHLPTLDFLTKSELILSTIHTIPPKVSCFFNLYWKWAPQGLNIDKWIINEINKEPLHIITKFILKFLKTQHFNVLYHHQCLCYHNLVVVMCGYWHRGFIKFLCRRLVGFFSWAFLVCLMKESKKRRRKQPGKSMARCCSQLVNHFPGARFLMNPLTTGLNLLHVHYLYHMIIFSQ